MSDSWRIEGLLSDQRDLADEIALIDELVEIFGQIPVKLVLCLERDYLRAMRTRARQLIDLLDGLIVKRATTVAVVGPPQAGKSRFVAQLFASPPQDEASDTRPGGCTRGYVKAGAMVRRWGNDDTTLVHMYSYGEQYHVSEPEPYSTEVPARRAHLPLRDVQVIKTSVLANPNAIGCGWHDAAYVLKGIDVILFLVDASSANLTPADRIWLINLRQLLPQAKIYMILTGIERFPLDQVEKMQAMLDICYRHVLGGQVMGHSLENSQDRQNHINKTVVNDVLRRIEDDHDRELTAQLCIELNTHRMARQQILLRLRRIHEKLEMHLANPIDNLRLVDIELVSRLKTLSIAYGDLNTDFVG
jgi:hypothetical protein